MNGNHFYVLFIVWIFLFQIISCNTIDNEVSTVDLLDDNNCTLTEELKAEITSYANVTNQIIEYITNGSYKGQAWSSLAEFVDRFGSRIAGSTNLEDSIDYMSSLLSNNGLDVHTEEVQIPVWTRGYENAELLSPRKKTLPILGLGFSVGTPENGIEADVIVVRSFAELHNMSYQDVRGKIVVYAQPFVSYGVTVEYRSKGASEASKKGAVAALVRSITPFSLNTPHTGMQRYIDNVVPIPVAAITVEDALELLRFQRRGESIRIKLKMSAKLEQGVSRNTIADLQGRENSKKFVVVSGHLDSWDVGEGAIDDGGGAFISWIAPVVLKQLNLKPRRTLRAILWTAEEQGGIGSTAYVEAHKEEIEDYVFVMESDIGTFDPLGLSYIGSKEGECIMREIGKLFASIQATQIVVEDPGTDLSGFMERGIPAGGLRDRNDNYFWYHHSEADRVTAVDSDALDKCAAYWTAFSYIVADLTIDVPKNKQN